MAKQPPHILVTTPESLFILLTTERGRAALGAAAHGDRRRDPRDRRRQARRAPRALARAARSARRADDGPRAGARRAVGDAAADRADRAAARRHAAGRCRTSSTPATAASSISRSRSPTTSSARSRRTSSSAASTIGSPSSSTQHRSTIVFVNTRRLVERAAAALEQRLGEEHVVAHHGSMSRALRLAAEQKLKHGQVKCAVATASLELGIDVGAVDLVVQLGSPRSIATLLQRVGRSGHHARRHAEGPAVRAHARPARRVRGARPRRARAATSTRSSCATRRSTSSRSRSSRRAPPRRSPRTSSRR